MSVKRLLAAIGLLAISVSGAIAAPGDLKLGICEAEIARASAKFGVPLPILYAVGLTESGGSGTLQPLLVATKTVSYVGKNLPDAIRKFNEIRATGTELIDLGCLQANYYWHKAEFRSLEEMFDPRANVEQAARFLSELYKRHGSWVMAAARYNAGPKNTPAQQRYVCNVMRNLVRSGFGSWTPRAKDFCDAPPEAVGVWPPKEAQAAQAAAAPAEPTAGGLAQPAPGRPLNNGLPKPNIGMPLSILPTASAEPDPPEPPAN